AETDFFRDHHAKRRVIDFEIPNQGRQTKIRFDRLGLAIRDDLLDVHRRRKSVEGDTSRVNDLKAIPTDKPNSSISGFRRARAVAAYKARGVRSVERVENGRADRLRRVPLFDLFSRDANQAARSF